MSVLEYVLLVGLVAMASVGALMYVGESSGSPSHVANQAALGVSGDDGGGPGGAKGTWCSSGDTACTDSIAAGGQQVVHFWASGGTGSYRYSLAGAPAFVALDAGAGDVDIRPSCAQPPGAYDGISIVVTDSSGHVGKLTFSLTVSKGASC
ncbi:MAG: hypothetical protein ACRDZX_00980 [Acidimicrobiales bacterium]